MNNRFTEKAQRALNTALMAARELGHTYIGSEHILIGLAKDNDGVAAQALLSKGIDAHKITDVIIQSMGKGNPTTVNASDMTPRTKRILEMSAYTASRSCTDPLS